MTEEVSHQMLDSDSDGDVEGPEIDAAPIHASSLTFNDGTVIETVPGHVVVLVGANNVGKSSALRDIAAQVRTDPRQGHRVVSRVRIAREQGHPAPLVEWVKTRFPRFRQGSNDPWVYGTAQATVNETKLSESQLDPNTLRQIHHVVTFVANAQERLELTKPAAPIDLRHSAPRTPIQALYNATEKIERLSDASYAAFGQKLTYSHHDGHWRLRLGVPEIEAEVTGRHLFPTDETKASIESLPVVEEQGDGLRSYLGVLLELLAERHLFVILDEPEAFLHPPQARQLAAAIMQVKQTHAQLFVATHDPNFVRGLLDTKNASQLSIVRIQRMANQNPVRVIAPETVRAVANDPVLRHSSILDSLFSTGAVVCEAEPDCDLYESALVDNGLVPPGVTLHFVGSSGKERVRKTCTLLAKLGVPTAAVLDFDVLKSPDDVIALLEALGEPADEELAARILKASKQLDQLTKAKQPTKAQVLEQIRQVLTSGKADEPMSNTTVRKIDALVRGSGDWALLKKHGVSETRGALNQELKKLIADLAGKNLHVVPVGELEGWFDEAEGKKAAYVVYVLENSLHTNPSLNAPIRDFVRRIADGLK